MPKKAKGKKAAAKAEKKAKKGEEKAHKFKALAALDAFVLKIKEELARLRKDPASLFDEPPPKQECPLCMLPIPFQPDKTVYVNCCGNTICSSCMYAQQKSVDKSNERRDVHSPTTCPFCRKPKVTDITERLEKRMLLNDPCAFDQASDETPFVENLNNKSGNASSEEWLGLFYACRAASMDNLRAVNKLTSLFLCGNRLIAKDTDIACMLLEYTARRGDVSSRFLLGVNMLSRGPPAAPEDDDFVEITIKFYQDASKHFKMSAARGHKESVNKLIY